jgi:hypothetical protein
MADLHRPLTAELDLASSLSRVQSRVIDNHDTSCFAGRRYQSARADVRAGRKRQHPRVELRLDGTLKGRYQGRSLELAECGPKAPAAPVAPPKPPRKDHHAGGQSHWMEGFWEHPARSIGLAMEESNRPA